MFNFCGWMRSRKDHIDRNSKHYDQVQKTLSEEEQAMLQLIYNDLAIRNKDNLLTYQNFLLFFGLTGLWGAKLFRQFDQEGRKLISKEEFFYGLSRTAKAAYSEKIKLLFNFFKDDEDNGIKFIDFTKMLYNYSRDQLKEILMEDLCTSPELNKKITKPSHSLQLGTETSSCYGLLLRSIKSQSPKKPTVIEVNYQQPNAEKEDMTCFGKYYGKFSEYKDPGTIMQVKMNEFTYKVNYCNMITLVKEFARNIYKSYNIDTKTGIFTFPQFSEWILSHAKLFQSYYTSFHIDIWSYSDGEPNFLSKAERSFEAKMKWNKKIKKVYAMMVGDMLIIADDYTTRKSPTKVVCLDGLTMDEVRDQHGYGILLSHRDDYYPQFALYFDRKAQQETNLQSFRVFEGDTLHDLFDVHEMIGTGKFSIVYRCTQKQTGKSYALKDISTQKMTSKAITTLDNESQIMKILTHAQIVKYSQTIRSKGHIYIVTQYICGKDLYEYVRKRKRLSEYISAYIIGKIIEAIIHRDLKPENIMVMMNRKSLSESNSGDQLNDEGIENIKLIDFGLANHQSQLQKNCEEHGIAGTPNYIAPEVILENKTSCKSDIFSIGSILYFLLSGKLAFAYNNMIDTLFRTAKGEYDLTGQIWNNVSEQAKDLVSKLLDPHPQTRIGLDEALNHKWFEVVSKNANRMAYTQQSSEMTVNVSSVKSVRQDKNIKPSTLSKVEFQAMLKQEVNQQRLSKITN